MVYAIIAGGVFLSDLILKRYMDKKYARKVRHPRLGGRIVLEKYYNKGAALNFMVKRPNLLRIIHTVILVVVAPCRGRIPRPAGGARQARLKGACAPARRRFKQPLRPLHEGTCRRLFSSEFRSEMAARDRLQHL